VSGPPTNVVGKAPLTIGDRASPAMLRESRVIIASRTPGRIENGACPGSLRKSS
jgi:hypothetical protein